MRDRDGLRTCHHLLVTPGASSTSDETGNVPTRSGAPITRRQFVGDAALALVVFLLEVLGILSRLVEGSGDLSFSLLGDIPVASYLLLAASSVALLWRRRRPLVVLAATLTASVVWDLLDLADGPSLAILVSLYGAGRFIPDLRTSILAVASAMVLVGADDLLVEREALSVLALSLGLVLVAWYVGRRVRSRIEYLALIEERAEYRERERAAEARRAVDEERTRIARELHDLVAHRVSMMTIQAGAAQTVSATDPERATRAMKAVEDAGRDALDELRQILAVLRSDGGRGDLTPVHGLAELPALVAQMRSAGMDVSLARDGIPEIVPTQVGLAAYRIVQEALTNVMKHAGPDAVAEVRVSGGNHMLTVEVTDRGAGDSGLPGSGQGLVGMRERAALLGGDLAAGPRPDGGFRVTARIPLRSGSS